MPAHDKTHPVQFRDQQSRGVVPLGIPTESGPHWSDTDPNAYIQRNLDRGLMQGLAGESTPTAPEMSETTNAAGRPVRADLLKAKGVLSGDPPPLTGDPKRDIEHLNMMQSAKQSPYPSDVEWHQAPYTPETKLPGHSSRRQRAGTNFDRSTGPLHGPEHPPQSTVQFKFAQRTEEEDAARREKKGWRGNWEI